MFVLQFTYFDTTLTLGNKKPSKIWFNTRVQPADWAKINFEIVVIKLPV